MDNKQIWNELVDDDFVDEWDRRRRLNVQLVCKLAHYSLIHNKRVGFVNPLVVEEKLRRREIVRQELVHTLRFNKRSRDCIRMEPKSFLNFCNLLRNSGRLTDTHGSKVEEQVLEFLLVVSLNFTNRALSLFFRRSGETVSRHFHRVLRAIISLEDQFLKQPDGSEVPEKILNNPRFYPYFKGCLGALDGTHVRVNVPSNDAPRYRGRKDNPTTNVLAACSFDLKFTYVLAGWEGTASDSRIIKNALTREDNLKIPNGKFYLVDSGYMLKSSLITPYRGVRYHLKEYATRGPENPRELFNLRHASLRNVVERAFGVLKKRFPIVGSMPIFPVATQTEIILACCILHNFLMGVECNESLISEVDRELLNQREQEEVRIEENADEDFRLGEAIRDMIAASMWLDYQQGTNI